MSKECCNRVCTARYTFAVLASICLGMVYAFKMLVSLALLFMMDDALMYDKTPQPKECLYPVLRRVPDGPLIESHMRQGIMLGSYYMGFLVSQIPFALLAERASAKCVMATAITGNTICAFVSPIFARFLPFEFFCALRAIQGFLSGGAVPAANVMIGRWCPPEERYLMYGIVYSGPGLGVVLGTGLPGLVMWCGANWDWMFYSLAIIGLVVTILWIVLVGEAPWNAQFITEEERKFIMDTTEDVPEAQEPYKFPWSDCCTSCRFWAIALSHFCSNVGWYFIITSLPSFMKWVMHLQAVQITMMLAATFLSCFVFSLDMSIIGMVVLEAEKVSVTSFRKISNTICSLFPAVAFAIVPLTGCNSTATCMLFIIAIISIGAMSSGVIPNCIDIAPNFAGMLIVNSNTFASIPGIVVPILFGWELDNHADVYQYTVTFGAIGVLYLLMFFIFTIFGSAEIQAWNFVAE